MLKKRLSWLDIAKGIAIIAVVFGHVDLIPWQPYRKIIFSFHMPLFFMAAGYTAKAELSWQSVKNSAKRLLLPYVLSCILMSLISLLKGSDFISELSRILWGSGVGADYGPGIPITGASSIPTVGAIWFLPCIFFSKTMFSALLFLTKERKEWQRVPIVLFFSAVGYIIGQYYKLPLCFDVALFTLIFFYAGYLFRQYKHVFKSVSMGAVFTVFWYLSLKYNALELSARYYRDFPFCIVTTLGAIAASYLIFFVCEEILDRFLGVRHILMWCGTYSMNLLLIHHFDGILWRYQMLFPWLDRFSFSSNTVHGFAVATVQIFLYILLCMVYVCGKKFILSRFANKQKSQSNTI